jgi:MinD superfamily P-loop ATPase
MKELVVISGKGGTGKTSLAASLAALAAPLALADCDVDASDLPIVLEPDIRQRHDFVGGEYACIIDDLCNGCGKCEALCRFEAVLKGGAERSVNLPAYHIDETACEGCGVCAWFCPEKAIEMRVRSQGEWFLSETRFGPMAHARLNPGGENSGKLVTVIKKAAKEDAKERGLPLVLCDGSPGIGCPVIASLAGTDLALVVTEPTLPGKQDMERVLELTRWMRIPAAVCINRFDLNTDLATAMESELSELGVPLLGRIRYDRSVVEAQMKKLSVIEYSQGKITEEIKRLWSALAAELKLSDKLKLH